MKNVLGGRVRFMVSGGAPLNIEIKSFLTVIFSAPIFEAYGITESAGSVTCTAFWDR
jgi:long-chain acyl-CoA synthetase